MHRFFLPPDQTRDSTLTLSGSEAHHALHVVRIRENERVVVLDGAGHEIMCEVEQLERHTVRLKRLQRREVEQLERHTVRLKRLQRQAMSPLPYRVTLAQAVTKAKTMDLIVQKATELGVHRIAPILSERSVPWFHDEAASSKLEKWQATTVEAIKQCGSPWLPQIDLPQTPQKFLAGSERMELTLVASLQPESRHPREYFQNFRSERQRQPKSVCVWVGPEGDFTPAEMNAIRQGGALPMSLGPVVLRSETAAIYCLSILNYELQAP
jgi:16S rRNA (uracil1498-N3)-methyltransferase